MAVADDKAAPSRQPITLGGMLARFPNVAIVSNPALERWIINWVWATVPLQYYVLTRFSGGLRDNEWLAIVVSVASCMLLILATSFLLALVFPMKADDDAREVRLRAWSVALITHWTAAVTLLAASFLVASLFGIENQDLVWRALCPRFVACPWHPALLQPSTILIFFVYAVAAMLLVFVVLKQAGGARTGASFPAPFTFAVIAISTLLLAFLYSATTWRA